MSVRKTSAKLVPSREPSKGPAAKPAKRTASAGAKEAERKPKRHREVGPSAKFAVVASDESSRVAAENALLDGGTAVDAVMAAYFALAGARPDGLLAPMTALVIGPGTGGRVYDGRAAQPGLGVPRPRGFVHGSAIPRAALAAVPRAPHAALLLHAKHGKRSLAKAAAEGVATARAAGAKARAAFLKRFGEAGALAISSERDAFLRVAGQFASGLLTEADLDPEPARAGQEEAAKVLEVEAEDDAVTRVLSEPWPSPEEVVAAGREARTVVVADSRGMLAALAVHVSDDRAPEDQLVVPEIELSLPLMAEPVRRGETRVAPGTIIPARRALYAVDCGPDLRAALAVDAVVEALAIGAAFGRRPVEHGLDVLAGSVRGRGVLAIARGARPFVLAPPAERAPA